MNNLLKNKTLWTFVGGVVATITTSKFVKSNTARNLTVKAVAGGMKARHQANVSLNKIRVFGREKFGELSGLAQQYLFYYARENNIKIEE